MESHNLYVPFLGGNLYAGKNLSLGYAISPLLGGVI